MVCRVRTARPALESVVSLIELLEGLTFTAPYSIDDAKAVHAMIHQLAPTAVVDVYQRGADVVVEVRTERGTIARVCAVV